MSAERAGGEVKLSLFAAAAPGLEPLVAEELRALGAKGIDASEAGGIGFAGDAAMVCRANLWLRVAGRVLVRMGAFHASSFSELERHARRLPWGRFVAGGETARFRVSCQKSRLYHSGAVAERLGEAVARATGARVATGGGEDAEAGEQLFLARIVNDECVVSADASGALLHQRGYRLATGKAPLRETLAAAMLLGCNWQARGPLVDPMCGSGTIAIEAARMARRMAPGMAREFRFLKWPGFEPAIWRREREAAIAGELAACPVSIVASDRDPGAVTAARENAARAGVDGDIDIAVRSLTSLVVPAGGAGWLVSNPPYGVRVGERRRLGDLYTALGRMARERLAGWTLALLSDEAQLDRRTGLALAPALATKNGGIAVRLWTGRV